MLALSLGMKEEALENTEWIVNFNQLQGERAKLYRAISVILRTDLDDTLNRESLSAIWKLMFGSELLSTAMDIVDAKIKFLGMPEDDLSLNL